MTVKVTVGVVVVGTNERRWLTTCLSTLRASTTGDVGVQVYYVDNASGDGSVEYVSATYPETVVIVNDTNLGFTGANNIGMRRALADGVDYVFLVNPDTSTPPMLIADLFAFMQQWPGYGIVGPLQKTYELDMPVGDDFNAWSREALAAGEAHVFANDLAGLPSHADPGSPRAPGTVEHAYVQGSAFFVRACVLRNGGLFDETFHTYYEEVDLCRRARLAGWRVALITDLTIGHYGGGGTSGSTYRRRHMMRNKYYYLVSDIELSRGAMARIALHWLTRDVSGHGVGGESSIPVALGDVTRTTGWLLLRARRIAGRRSDNRAVRAAQIGTDDHAER